jgi:hypothetical protein
MKAMLLVSACLFTAFTFDPGGPASDDDAPDAGEFGDDAAADTGDAALDADAGADAAPPAATIACAHEAIDGYPKVVLTFGGDIESGFLGEPTGAEPSYIAYGSNQEDLAVNNGCPGGSWTVPYPSGCGKPTAAWGTAPKLVLEPEVDELNVALVYDDGSSRWGDLKTDDGDGVGFTVSGLDCRVELTGGGTGGYIRTKL